MSIIHHKQPPATPIPAPAPPPPPTPRIKPIDVLNIVDELLEANLEYTEETKKLREFIQKRLAEKLLLSKASIDAERNPLVAMIDEHLAHGEIVGIFDTLRKIRVYLTNGVKE